MLSRAPCGHMIAPLCGCKPVAEPAPELTPPVGLPPAQVLVEAPPEVDEELLARFAEVEAARNKIKRRRMRESLSAFFKEAWANLNPGTPLEWGPHIQAVCDHVQWQLEDRARAKTDMAFKMRAQNLVINVPPRSLKTKILTCATIWAWLRWPDMRIMYLSANPRVAWNSAREARDMVVSSWFQKTFEPTWKIRSDQNALTDLGNTAGGARISRGLEGAITGEGADWIIVDDPHDLRDSIENIEKCIEGYDSAVHNRINNPRAAIRTCIMQRVNIADFTAHVLKKGWRHLCIPMEYEVKKACTCKDCQSGTSPYGWKDSRTREGERLHHRFTPEFLEGERLRLGPFGYACTPAETPILMGDWTEKRIADVRAGDTVVGFSLGTPEERARLVEATVKNVFEYELEVFKLIMESGRRVRCTAEHKWYMKKRDSAGRPNYLPAIPGRSRLALVAEPLADEISEQERRDWCYLAGIIDGEGSLKQRCLTISQSPGANPEVFAKIEEVLKRLNISYTIWRALADNPKWSERGHFTIHDTPRVLRSLLKWGGLGKACQAKEALYRRGGAFVKERDRVLRSESLGVQKVYALETTTGNYIAWGYASSNSQMQQRPSVAGGGRIKKDWWGFFRLSGVHAGDHERPPGCNETSEPRIVQKHKSGWNRGKWDLDWIALTVDAANKKTDRGSAYGMLALGGKDMRRFVLDDRTQRGEFNDILDVLRDMIITWRPDKILVEAKAAGPSLMSSLDSEMKDGKLRAHDLDANGNDTGCRGLVKAIEIDNAHLWKCSKCDKETNGNPIICVVEPIEVDIDKERRVDAVLPQLAARLVYLLEGAPWLAEFVEEHALFPESPWNDRVDALSQALEHFRDGPFYVL